MPNFLPNTEIRDADLRKMEQSIWNQFGRLRYVSVSTDYAAKSDIECIFCTNTVTITLPQAAGNGGKVYYIRNVGTGTITISSADSGDYFSTTSLAAGEKTILISNNNNWYSF